MEVVEDLTDYKELEEQLRKEITDEGRFVRIEDRQDSGVLTDQIISSLSHGKLHIPNSMNDFPVMWDLFMRTGLWDRQGANIASRYKEMYVLELFLR